MSTFICFDAFYWGPLLDDILPYEIELTVGQPHHIHLAKTLCWPFWDRPLISGAQRAILEIKAVCVAHHAAQQFIAAPSVKLHCIGFVPTRGLQGNGPLAPNLTQNGPMFLRDGMTA